MTLTFQIVLIIVLVISFLGAVAEKENDNLRATMAGTSVVAIVAFILTITLL